MTSIRPAVLALFLTSATPALLAQDQDLERELDFVRALAEKMRFIELAKGEVDRLAKEYRGAGDQDRIAQLGVQISYHGAKGQSDREVQRTLFKEAIDKSRELIERSSDAKVLVQARSTLADASEAFGQFLIEELELAREASPEHVKELEDEAASTFRAGIDACGKVMEALEPDRRRDELKNVQYGLFWMRKGVLMREQARAVKEDRGVFIERAVEDLTDLVLDFGEETALGLRGLFEIAQCREVEGEGHIDEALDIYRATIEQIQTSLREADQIGLPGETQALLFQMMQEVYVKTANVLLQQGDSSTGELFEQFRTAMKEFGEKDVELFDVVDPNWGHRMLLAEARFKAESGDQAKIAEAIAMAQRINDKHPNDYVGIKAKQALGDILAVQKSLVSGKLLFEIAKGEFQNNNYEAAIKGLRRALGAMSTQEAQEIGLESWQMLGTAFALTDRYLEATIALGRGLEQFGDTDEDRAGDTADTLDRAIGLLKRQTKNDELLTPFYDQYAQLIATHSVAGAGKIFYKEGNNALIAKDYQRAIEQYRQVPPDFQLYETTQIRIAKAYAFGGKLAEARQTLADYRKYVDEHALDSRDAGLKQVRDAALEEAEFVDALMAYWEARGNDTIGLEKSPTKYQAAIEALRKVTTNQKDNNNVPRSLEMLGRLQADIGEFERAEEAYAQLKPKDPTGAARLATEIFREYQNQAKTLEDELAKAIKDGADDRTIDSARDALKKMRGKIGALGLDYIGNSPKPQLAVLVNTMNAFEALGEWKRVDEIAHKTLDEYGSDTNSGVKNVIDLTVRPMIGEALLRQRKFTQAYEMLTEAEKANPQQYEIKRQIARCLGGWYEIGTGGVGAREPGLDRPEEAYLKYYTEYRPWALRPGVEDYSLEWYQFQWECFWFARQAAAKDSKYKDIADKFYRAARSTDNFATLKSYGEKGLELLQKFNANR
ncbi:MAG: hypothetical protein KDE27_12510 [Planctomycetes bacterium]|nr:hypothetical protein [Planctomycetota bacterium]